VRMPIVYLLIAPTFPTVRRSPAKPMPLMKHKYVVRGDSPYCDVPGCERLEYDNIHNVMLLEDMIPTSELNEKWWAVLSDAGAHCDLTHQEAQQLVMALQAQGHAGLTIVSNEVGKRALERGYIREPENR